MLYVFVVCAFAVGVTIALLARAVVRNRRRIEQLEQRLGALGRRQRAHGFVIRHLAEESIEPDEPEPPPGRREFRVYKGAAVLLGLFALVRAHPARAAVAAAATAGVALALVLPALSQASPPATGALGARPSTVAAPAPAQAPPSAVPSSGAPAMPAAPTASPTSVPSHSPSLQPTGSALLVAAAPSVSTLATPPASASAPPPTSAAPPPSSPAPPSSSPPPTKVTPTPSPSGTQSCLIDLDLPPLMRLCLL